MLGAPWLAPFQRLISWLQVRRALAEAQAPFWWPAPDPREPTLTVEKILQQTPMPKAYQKN